MLSALVLVLPASVVAQPGYLCRISGQVSRSCCCVAKHRPQREAQVKRGGCCDFIEAAQVSISNLVPEGARPFIAPAVAATFDHGVLLLRAQEGQRPYRQLQYARPPGPARYLALCSLLI